MDDDRTVEEMCRELLAEAIRGRILIFNVAEFEGTTDVSQLTSGDLAGMANMLESMLGGLDDDVSDDDE